jgi:hypothetical protein
MRIWIRIAGLIGSVILLIVFLKCGNLTAYYFWAAGLV